ncbi:MAG TPA: A/G-specific adenine glycosylase [Candidatus Paceibacterota bacterium]|nr:A/G-specific adenine glycosylase [Candidatus Paceibacterota bacterium]
MTLKRFIGTVKDYHRKSGRHDLPWRLTRDPYEILVSEVMLQQTQVSRVLRKWPEFLRRFPTVQALARASVADVLAAWQGLGYNRRALALKRAAEAVVRDFGGEFPRDAAALESLPGVGPSTRGAVMAFAWDMPTVFIETNIRAVYLHHFFRDPKGTQKSGIHDRDILPLVEQTLDRHDPRSWYYALMDYGVHLKQTLPNPSRASRHHVRQSAFKGSNREMRSRIVKAALEAKEKGITVEEATKITGSTEETKRTKNTKSARKKKSVKENLQELTLEGFLVKRRGRYFCA